MRSYYLHGTKNFIANKFQRITTAVQAVIVESTKRVQRNEIIAAGDGSRHFARSDKFIRMPVS